jgi:hypothetical protein
MAKYKDIGGTTVGFRSGSEEYTYPSGFEGSIYYNSGNGQFEFVGLGTGTWSSGGNLNTKRYAAGASGTQTAGAIFGGDADGGSPRYGLHEQYDGSSWTEAADLNQEASYTGGTGTQTAALKFGGYSNARHANAETWNGSSWTEVGDLNTARFGHASVGHTSTSAFAVGGSSAASGSAAIVEQWDGSSWTEIADINSGRAYFGGSGLTTAGLVFGGNPENGYTESWNGSSWTEVADMNTDERYGVGSGTQGTNTDALGFGGGYPTVTVNTESWNGTAWTELNNLATGRRNLTGVGSPTAALAVGGEPPILTATEEWTVSHAIKTVTTS